jgi:hypothetical protein
MLEKGEKRKTPPTSAESVSYAKRRSDTGQADERFAVHVSSAFISNPTLIV